MYSSQAAKRVVIFLAEGGFSSLDDLGEKVSCLEESKKEILRFFLHGRTFRVVCDRTGVHGFNSMDAEQAASAGIRKIMKDAGADVLMNLKAPDVELFLRIVDDRFLLGVDCAGRELSKRQHLVFNNATATKGTIGYCALLFAGYKPGMLVLDPFALSGNIMIEAALYESGTPVNYYTKQFTLLDIPAFRPFVEDAMKRADAGIKAPPSKPNIICTDSSFGNVSAEKKNAKIAGVEKFISFSRTDTENLDIKTFSAPLDVVCSRIIEPSSNVPEARVRKIYEKFFDNLQYITKKSAALVFIVRNTDVLEEEAARKDYTVLGRKQVHQGQQAFWLVKMGRE
jgi:23S rRNA G2445 N2-methylase RlmL